MNIYKHVILGLEQAIEREIAEVFHSVCASGKGKIGIPKKVAAEFVAADKPGKLPKYAPKSKRGKR